MIDPSIYIGKKVLITTSAWFFAPDGLQYRAIWGTLRMVEEAKNVVGFTPARSQANWIAEVGRTIIMGCQINYCTLCPDAPPKKVDGWQTREHEMNVAQVEYQHNVSIYHDER